jgi:phosphoribosylanthranilate isomerase
MIIQIYEIQTLPEAEKVLELGADHIGSVLTSSESWKQPELLETIKHVLASGARSSLIPLFDDMDIISSAIDYYQPDIVHFCHSIFDGSDQWEPLCGRLLSMQATIKHRFPQISIMRSIPIAPPGAGHSFPVMELARHLEPLSDYFLTDTLLTAGSSVGNQPETGYVGITGSTCDWNTAAALVSQSSIPVIAAGGLSPENVSEAIRVIRPAGVDSCSLTNAEDESGRPIRFRKDTGKVARFVAEARRAAKDILN